MKSDLEIAIDRLDIKLGDLSQSTSKWTTLERVALFNLSTNVVNAFHKERA